MPRIKEGFKGERIVVLPGFLIEELKRDPLGRELYITEYRLLSACRFSLL